MSEYEILEGINLSYGAAWSQLQWWASVSFGIIALTHLAADRLNVVMVAGVTILYTLFTIYVYFNITASTAIAVGYHQELTELQASGESSAAARNYLAHTDRYRDLNGKLFHICMVFTYFGTLYYLFYSYRKSLQKEAV